MLFFLIFLCVAGAIDITYRKCFNWLIIFWGMMTIVIVIIFPKIFPTEISTGERFLSALAGFTVLLLFYFYELIGAGDVKFAAILGFWVGWKLLLPIWALSCLFSVAHGLFVRYFFWHIFCNYSKVQSALTKGNNKFIPYVTYMSVATVMVLGVYKN